MTPRDFVEILRDRALNAAIRGTKSLLENPPGRKPRAEIVELNKWYKSLPDDQQELLWRVIKIATHQAVFGVLAILDGARVVDEDLDKGSFHLSFRRGSVESSLTGTTELLHDLLSDDDPAQNP